MELVNMSAEQIRSYEQPRRNELEVDIRHEIVKLKMDIFAEKGKHVGQIKKLKKSLARILTVNSETNNTEIK